MVKFYTIGVAVVDPTGALSVGDSRHKRDMKLIRRMWPTIVAYLAVSLLTGLSSAGAAGQETGDRLLLALQLEPEVTLCGEPVPVDDTRVVERFEKEMLVALGNRPQVILWVKRSTRFFPFIERSLAENELPDDIKYLAIAESALRLHAGSRKGRYRRHRVWLRYARG